MMDDLYDDEYIDPRDEDPNLVCIDCPHCSGTGTYNCHCGGDLCFCGEDESDCYYCDMTGKKYITKEQNEKRIKEHHEMMKAIWGDEYKVPEKPVAGAGEG